MEHTERVRLFVAVWPDEPTRAVLRSVAPERCPGLRPVDPAQWHVTLRFMGRVDPFVMPALVEALGSAAAPGGPVEARLGPATGWLGRGSVLQVPVSGLDELAGSVRSSTSGVVPEASDTEPVFRGHLTLARADRQRRLDARARAELAGRPVAAAF
ncbi:MAG: hypothetical protein JO368_09875, partial [Acidimicrobiales bacterium]|nr:hypothetical protein [Acidimicrobiales bacterium]